MPPPPNLSLPYFHENMHDFRPPSIFQDAGCVHASIWSGRHTPLLINASLVCYAKRNQGNFVFYCTRVFCMFSKRNAKSSRLGFVLHSHGIAISARATANNVDMVLYSSQRLWAVCLSATAHHVALVCCCTHRSRQHVATIDKEV